VSRATLSVVLSYAEFDARGDRNLPSLFLDSFAIPADPSRAVRPAPRRTPPPSAPVEIRTSALLDEIAARSARLSPSALESYLQCPFQYFGGKLLRLKSPPPRPEERLDFMTQGTIVHAVLKEWWAARGDIAALFDELFAREAAAKRIPISYQTERARHAMLDDLLRFAEAAEPPLAEVHTEQDFEYALDGVAIFGKIDRIDVAAGGRATVVDYKYSNAQNTKAKLDNDNLLQAPLYLLAAERAFGYTPEAMFYIGLKGAVQRVEWPTDGDWQQRAIDRTLGIVRDIRSGRIEVSPSDPGKCRFCDSADICRVETAAPVAIEVTA
jgi:ATP-dependent helicase/nuclease subunit B